MSLSEKKPCVIFKRLYKFTDLKNDIGVLSWVYTLQLMNVIRLGSDWVRRERVCATVFAIITVKSEVTMLRRIIVTNNPGPYGR